MTDPAPFYRKIKSCLDRIDDFIRRTPSATYDEVNAVEIARQCVEALEGDPASMASLLVIGAIDPNGIVVCNECGSPMRSDPRHAPKLHCPRCS